uniref:Uncharacterized protein n=1 Tax=Rhizophora mucronata TaxID=61149 RepID=A0A2P2PIP2_RHIMU
MLGCKILLACSLQLSDVTRLLQLDFISSFNASAYDNSLGNIPAFNHNLCPCLLALT